VQRQEVAEMEAGDGSGGHASGKVVHGHRQILPTTCDAQRGGPTL
jgi:hypothetical protein